MTLPKDILELFCNWTKDFYGIIVSIHDPPRRDGELARFMLGDALFVVRPFFSAPSEAIEIFSSDAQKMEDVEKQFTFALRKLLGEKTE